MWDDEKPEEIFGSQKFVTVTEPGLPQGADEVSVAIRDSLCHLPVALCELRGTERVRFTVLPIFSHDTCIASLKNRNQGGNIFLVLCGRFVQRVFHLILNPNYKKWICTMLNL